MKQQALLKKVLLLSALFILMFASCEEEVPIPTASTQANYTYEFSVVTNEDTEDINFHVVFTNNSINATGFHWDFGNGETSTEENPELTYSEGGVFEVTLTVSPKEDLHYNVLEKSERMLLVATILQEEFNDPSLATDFPPEGWKLIDADGDGHNWYWGTSEGEFYILSDSWYQSDNIALTPDNWIITPKIDLTDVSGAALDFEVTPRANNPAFRTEKYAVLISTTGTEIDDFEEIYVETLQPDMENWVWILRSLNLSDYAGEEIHIAFRHFDCTDLWSIVMTNIHIYETGGK